MAADTRDATNRRESITLDDLLSDCREFKLGHRAHTKAYNGFRHLEWMINALRSETRASLPADAARVLTKLAAYADDLDHRRFNGHHEWIPLDLSDFIVLRGLLDQSAPVTETASVSSIDFHQRRGMLADTVDWALTEYDEYMKDDAYDAQAVLDTIIMRLRKTRFATTGKV